MFYNSVTWQKVIKLQQSWIRPIVFRKNPTIYLKSEESNWKMRVKKDLSGEDESRLQMRRLL